MQTRTQLGLSLGQLLGNAFLGGDAEYRQKGMLDGMKASELYANNELARAKRDEVLADTALKRRQLDLDPYEIAAGQLGIDGSLGKQLKQYALSGDYGNGSIETPNMMSDGTRNLANSYRTEFIKPESWDESLAKRYGQTASAIKYALTMGEKNPESYVKAINSTNQGDFLRGDTQQGVMDRANREAAIDGKVGDISKVRMVDQVASGGLDPQSFKSLVSALTLANGDQLYNFSQHGVGDNVTGAFTPNPNTEGPKLQYDSTRGMLIDQKAGTARPVFTVDGQPLATKAQTEKPLPVQAMRLQDENLDAISSVSGINSDLASFVKQIDSGALNLGVLANALSGAKNFAGMSDEQSRNLQSFKATLEKMRNTSLLLNKGVQTDGDAQRAWNELLTNINDPQVVRQRLVEIQALNQRAAKLRMARNNILRRNFGAPDMDYTPYLSPGAAIGGEHQPAQPAATPQRQVLRTGTLNGRRVVQFSDGSVQYAE